MYDLQPFIQFIIIVILEPHIYAWGELLNDTFVWFRLTSNDNFICYKCYYIMCQLLCSETDFAQPMLRFSLCRLSIGRWAINVCVRVCMQHACVLWRILFGCSPGPRRRVEAWHLLQHLSAKHRECSASSNSYLFKHFFLNLHSNFCSNHSSSCSLLSMLLCKSLTNVLSFL